jgi:hypothetical protein
VEVTDGRRQQIHSRVLVVVILTGVVEEGERQGRSRDYRREDSERGSGRVV